MGEMAGKIKHLKLQKNWGRYLLFGSSTSKSLLVADFECQQTIKNRFKPRRKTLAPLSGSL